MGYAAKNNAYSTLAGGITNVAVALTVQAGKGALFDVTAPTYTYATLEDASGNIEVVKVTARATDTLTIVRAQDGTAARAWNSGDIIECRPCAAAMNDYAVGPQIDGATAKTTPVDADKMGILDSAASYVLKYVTLANIKATLKTYFDALYLALTGGTLTGKLIFKAGLNNIASAATVDLTVAGAGNTVHITGTTGISAWTMTSGQVVDVVFDGILLLTHSATTNNLPGAANITTAANDRARLWYDGTAVWVVGYQKASGAAVAGGSVQIQPISASVAANALTISASALSLDFRSTTLGSGTVTTVSGTPANLVISSGSTLGTVSATQSRIAVLAMNNAGTIELAAVNISGGNNLSETGLISTTAEGGAGAAGTANVIYSTTARSNLAYRVIGYIESTQATAGTWATAPSTIQGAGGNAVTAMSSLGYGQTWSSVIGSRALTTTYYNTTGKPIMAVIAASVAAGSAGLTVTINGTAVAVGLAVAGAAYGQATVIIPPNASYSASITGGTLQVWAELR